MGQDSGKLLPKYVISTPGHMNYEEALSGIIGDNSSGSISLAMKVIDFYEESRGLAGEKTETAFRRISDAHTGMGLVRNVNRAMYGAYKRGEGQLIEEGLRLKTEIREQTESSQANATAVLPEQSVLVTISNSSMVREFLRRNAGRIRRVYVMESRPGLEGRQMAAFLEKSGIESILIPDAALHLVLKKCEMAVCGSDSVLGDRSIVHKIGTFPLMMGMHRYGKMTVSLTISLKFEGEYRRDSYPEFIEHDPQELAPGGMRALNLYYDITPPEYVSALVSDKGLIYPDKP